MNRILAFGASLFVAAIVFCADAKAETADNALVVAGNLEAEKQYALAASAYMAIVDGFDFMPGTSHSHELAALSPEAKVLIGKCGMTCLERGIELHVLRGGNLADCAEFQMLDSSANTMMHLEPNNGNWSYLRAVALIQQGKILEGNSLLDDCLRKCASDFSTTQKALQAKSQIQGFLAKR